MDLFNEELEQAKARIKELEERNEFLGEHAAQLRESFDAIQGVYLSESVAHIYALKQALQAQDRTIKALQSKVAKQKKALAGLQDVKFRLQKEEEQSRRYHIWRLKEENRKLEARVKDLQEAFNNAEAYSLEKRVKIEHLQERLRVKAETITNLERALVKAWKKNLRDGEVGV